MMYLRIKVGAPQSDLKHGNVKFTSPRAEGYILSAARRSIGECTYELNNLRSTRLASCDDCPICHFIG